MSYPLYQREALTIEKVSKNTSTISVGVLIAKYNYKRKVVELLF